MINVLYTNKKNIEFIGFLCDTCDIFSNLSQHKTIFTRFPILMHFIQLHVYTLNECYLYLSKTTYGPKNIEVHTFSEKLKGVTKKLTYDTTTPPHLSKTIYVYVEDRFRQLVQLNFSFNNDSSKEEK